MSNIKNEQLNNNSELQNVVHDLVETDNTAQAVVMGSEVENQITTAKKYPRSIKVSIKNAETLATLNKEIAGSCFYVLKRKNPDGTEKKIQGKSVRLAEIMASTWQNLKYASRIIEEADDHVIAQGVAWDLENNVSASVEVSRSILTKAGKRYKSDMVNVTKLAAIAIAGRNAIFKVIPIAYCDYIYGLCIKVAVGEKKDLAQRRKIMLEKYQAKGCNKERVLEIVNKKGVSDINAQDLEDLIGMLTAVETGEMLLAELQTGEIPEGGGKPKVREPESKSKKKDVKDNSNDSEKKEEPVQDDELNDMILDIEALMKDKEMQDAFKKRIEGFLEKKDKSITQAKMWLDSLKALPDKS
jgi:hypothetical protein